MIFSSYFRSGRDCISPVTINPTESIPSNEWKQCQHCESCTNISKEHFDWFLQERTTFDFEVWVCFVSGTLLILFEGKDAENFKFTNRKSPDLRGRNEMYWIFLSIIGYTGWFQSNVKYSCLRHSVLRLNVDKFHFYWDPGSCLSLYQTNFV